MDKNIDQKVKKITAQLDGAVDPQSLREIFERRMETDNDRQSWCNQGEHSYCRTHSQYLTEYDSCIYCQRETQGSLCVRINYRPRIKYIIRGQDLNCNATLEVNCCVHCLPIVRNICQDFIPTGRDEWDVYDELSFKLSEHNA